MSLDARGKFAGALVFSNWKGRPTVRQLVTPANPKSVAQTTSRNAVRVAGSIQRWVFLTLLKRQGFAITDKARLIAAATPGQAWNGDLTRGIIGAGAINYAAAETAWAALAALDKTAWTNAANALTPPIPAVSQQLAGGAVGVAMPSGQVFYHHVFGMFKLGLEAAQPGAVPAAYA
jgi:hypothetical protein